MFPDFFYREIYCKETSGERKGCSLSSSFGRMLRGRDILMDNIWLTDDQTTMKWLHKFPSLQLIKSFNLTYQVPISLSQNTAQHHIMSDMYVSND